MSEHDGKMVGFRSADRHDKFDTAMGPGPYAFTCLTGAARIKRLRQVGMAHRPCQR